MDGRHNPHRQGIRRVCRGSDSTPPERYGTIQGYRREQYGSPPRLGAFQLTLDGKGLVQTWRGPLRNPPPRARKTGGRWMNFRCHWQTPGSLTKGKYQQISIREDGFHLRCFIPLAFWPLLLRTRAVPLDRVFAILIDG